MATTTPPGTMERILRLMSDKKASDVYLSAHSPALIKINGLCIPINNQVLPPDAPRNLLAEVIPADRMAELERIGELNMGFPIPGVGRFRVSAMRQRGSIAAVIRYIAVEVPALGNLGLPAVLGELIMQKRGLLLMVGATGSGKSTTLASMIDSRNEVLAGHILTIEDPIEFTYRNNKSIIHQRELNEDTRSFSNALRAALREDPDVILVGELRDLETIQLAVTAAETGHLVFATLHTSSASQTVDRMVDVFPAEQQTQIRVQLSGSLLAVFSQTLCKSAEPTSSGAFGRVMAQEIMINTPAIANLIREGKSSQLYSQIQTGASMGMQTLERALANLVEDGKVTRDEALLKTTKPEELVRLLDR